MAGLHEFYINFKHKWQCITSVDQIIKSLPKFRNNCLSKSLCLENFGNDVNESAKLVSNIKSIGGVEASNKTEAAQSKGRSREQ